MSRAARGVVRGASRPRWTRAGTARSTSEARPAGFEPATSAPEASALSTELRARPTQCRGDPEAGGETAGRVDSRRYGSNWIAGRGRGDSGSGKCNRGRRASGLDRAGLRRSSCRSEGATRTTSRSTSAARRSPGSSARPASAAVAVCCSTAGRLTTGRGRLPYDGLADAFGVYAPRTLGRSTWSRCTEVPTTRSRCAASRLETTSAARVRFAADYRIDRWIG